MKGELLYHFDNTILTSASFIHNIQGYAASLFTVLLAGTTLGASPRNIAFEGGDGTNFAPIMITDPADGSHTALAVSGISTNLRAYTFQALCSHLRFSYTGDAPNCYVYLYAERRA